MNKPQVDPVIPDDEKVDEWLRFLTAEGLEALSAYRAIRSSDIRAMFIRLMKEASQAEHESDPELH